MAEPTPDDVWYFAVPAPVCGPYESGEWLVFTRHAKSPGWWRLIARFLDQDRAETYAQIENDLYECDHPKPTELPASESEVPQIPPSAIQRLVDALSDIKKHAEVPASIAEIPTLEIDSPKGSHSEVKWPVSVEVPPPELVGVNPSPKQKIKPKGGHIPSTLWNEKTVARLTQLRSVDGLGFMAISKKMTEEFGPGYTKSACGGKADRLHLQPPAPELPVEEPPAVEPPAEESDAPPIPLTAEERIKKYGANPHVLKPFGWFDEKPRILDEAVQWYRGIGHIVYKVNGQIQLDPKPDVPATYMSFDEFLADHVNPARMEDGLEPFGLDAQAEAAE